jgi:Zn-dependent protease
MTTPGKPSLTSGDGMKRRYTLGNVMGLKVTAETSTIVSFIILWVVLAVIGRQLLNLTVADVFVGGFIAVLLHFAMAFLHQFGHAIAARSTGYPMIGIHLWTLLERSIYPRNEPQLPADIHIRRALGGPVISIAAAFILSILALLLAPVGGLVWYLVVFTMLDSLLVFGLGSLLPLGFTDGSTLLYWLPKRK